MVVVVDVVDIVVVWVFFSERVEYIVAAVKLAPVNALAAAMSARVVLDIVMAVECRDRAFYCFRESESSESSGKVTEEEGRL